MIYAVQVTKTGDWYIVEEKTPARASNYVRDVLDVLGEPDLEVKCDSIEAVLWHQYDGIATLGAV